jgi:hypothetical protein
MSAKEINCGTCLPPEAYMRLWSSASQHQQPKFKSSIFPIKNEVLRMPTKNKSRGQSSVDQQNWSAIYLAQVEV